MKTTIRCDAMTGLANAQTEVIIWPIRKEQLKAGNIHPDLDMVLQAAAAQGLFEARQNQIYSMPVGGVFQFKTVMLVGLGSRELQPDILRRAARAAGRAVMKLKAAAAAWVVPAVHEVIVTDRPSYACARALTEGFLHGAYRMKKYHLDQPKYQGVSELIYLRESAGLEDATQDWMDGMRTGQIIAEATNMARDLTNIPGNMLVPKLLADEAVKIATAHQLEVEILDEQQIADLGMGGLLAVGQGSANPPRMIVLKYYGADDTEDVFGLVGKGITFDTGGISLKKAAGMEEMISDMGGSAVVLGVMQAIALLRPRINVIAVIPSAENMPSSTAFKPGDIVKTLSGRTIEILNTDAEGRVVLADGITYAKQLGATKLIDVATLTGAVLVALGDVATGAVTNDETFLQEFIAASRRTGEKVWQLPAYDEFWDMLKSDVADLRNSTGSHGATITAGLFIGTFAEGLPWIHLDTGGTAFLMKDRGIDSKGATGEMVRTITELFMSQEDH